MPKLWGNKALCICIYETVLTGTLPALFGLMKSILLFQLGLGLQLTLHYKEMASKRVKA